MATSALEGALVTVPAPMTVYSKTIAGRLLAFEQKPSLPLPLRDMLKRVDGKTPYQQLVRQTGDAEVFEKLFLLQLVQIAPEPWRNSPAPSARPESMPLSQAQSLPTDVREAQFVPTVRQPFDDNKAAKPRLRLVPAPDGSVQTSKLQVVKSLMCDFIRAKVPLHAAATCAEIEAVTNEAQFLGIFIAYNHLIGPTGYAGQKHIERLLLTLAQA